MAVRKGLVVVYTGNGKGKTSAALGAAVRTLGHGGRVLIIQFFKGDWPVVYGELELAQRLHPQLEVLQLGRGFVKIMGDKKPFAEHVSAAESAVRIARERMQSGTYDLVILDEVIYALGYMDFKLIELADVLALIKEKPPKTHLILTGRNAPPEIVEAADLVTEMKEIKHPMGRGIPAQLGLDF
ncbi:MAG: cob(I)yrinic acid a,c-diamide adenosyltransferase [Candidatus Omnitrophica bacterium CG11_big_fil_rev_8_21_14_0_20_64_10]|nr:MAG: cob(I)yrinic acid a,c-diamide adenosyltransferase [Candidatus Omnitrophica bacterium CG11_big_fil_rev_8_21_14_0_20_64_10]